MWVQPFFSRLKYIKYRFPILKYIKSGVKLAAREETL
jgi:hypothetical protein